MQGEGNIIITNGVFDVCESCYKKLTFPFYYCREFDKAFCEVCEKGRAKRLCPSVKMEHGHLKIIEVRNETQKKR